MNNKKYLVLTLLTMFLIVFSMSIYAYGPPDYLPDGPHPRLILTPDKMDFIVSKVSTNDSDWQALYSKRNDYISGNPPYNDYQYILKWALLYKITNDTANMKPS